ncbi:hypothetical protein DL89DRAFT_320168 [Linderina pennispora]|uniref:tRNA pseudouridine(55) synthase n=1 Tax=Linderina pennispora TaxID=61395 RepID=A0A1Y1WMW2_9FUNG|nr:uncharacterized protein DL89DRAFT_320168 [Linderina pennispora]ORX74715.1 hypothetical protein DL89DRAFT_320168 [Linderina pennispora]
MSPVAQYTSCSHQPASIRTSLDLPAPDASACPLCLGILDHAHSSKVAEEFKAQAYDADDVSVSIELPKSIYIREHSMSLFAKRNLAAVNSGHRYPDIKDTAKFLISQRLVDLCSVQINNDSEMRVEVSFSHEESASEHQFLIDRSGSSIKTKTFRKRGLGRCPDDEFTAGFGQQPPAVATAAALDPPLERNISQTPFIVDNKRVTELSVAEVIGDPLKALVRSDEYNLVGSGREDADVRMLGDGRPFYVECINPRIKKVPQVDITKVEQQLVAASSPVQVRRLQIIKADDTSIIKEGQDSKTKLYCALVWFAKPLSSEKIEEINARGKQEIVLQQKTPIRVLHRRAPLTRPKRLLALEVRIESEAGTYIKEFVHGDLGRTAPSLADMAGVTADILELDVENVSLDFPPTLSS